jgi:formate--tetrahydrofolate ligase
LKNAIQPNLVQTLENNPAFIHGGPFANIAHGCNSVLATKLSMRLSEYTVTEAGFGADLGAEKFLNIKCRKSGIKPNAVVIVATVRALKLHGGVPLKELGKPNVEALDKGVENLKKHIENIHRFGLPVVVALNHFSTDTEEEIQFIKDKCAYLSVKIITASHWAKGGAGAEELAQAVVDVIDNTKTDFSLLYPDTCTLWQKVGIICREIYGATDVLADKKLRDKFHQLQESGFGHLPICMAKTQYSLSTDPQLIGRPKNFDVPLRDVMVSAGAGFVVVLTGDIMTMPGLPKVPAAESIDIDENEQIVGLF